MMDEVKGGTVSGIDKESKEGKDVYEVDEKKGDEGRDKDKEKDKD